MGMRDNYSDAEVSWDWQVGQFLAASGGQTYRARTIEALEQQLGTIIGIDARAYLQEMQLANPSIVPKRTVTKLQFMNLFRPIDLHRIYKTARGGDGINDDLSISVQIELERVNRASNDAIDLDDPDTVNGLIAMEQLGLVTAGDADRIRKGQPWA